MAGTMNNKCPLNRGVHLCKVKRVEFLCDWDDDFVSASLEVSITGGSTVLRNGSVMKLKNENSAKVNLLA